MTTLKQIRKEKRKTVSRMSIIPNNPINLTDKEQDECFKEWLQQKPEEHENHFWWKWVINELLEELE